jgi:GDP-L-fucose synthase
MLDSTRFLDRTGWRPRIDLEAGLRRLAAAEYAGH